MNQTLCSVELKINVNGEEATKALPILEKYASEISSIIYEPDVIIISTHIVAGEIK